MEYLPILCRIAVCLFYGVLEIRKEIEYSAI